MVDKTNKTGQPQPKPEETMTIKKSFMDNIEAQMKESRDTINMLVAAADKKKIARYKQQHRGKLPTTVCIRTLHGRAMLGWKVLEDKGAFQSPLTGAWMERQTITVVLEGKEGEKPDTKDMNYREFVRDYKLVKTTITGRTTNEETGDVVLDVIRQDNKKVYKIDVRYIN